MITICLGKDASEDILAALDSIDLSKELSQDDILHTQDRPMTPKKNMELISKVSNILMQSLNIDEILEKILDCIFDLLKRIDRGVVIIIDKETGEISEVIRRSEKARDDTGAMYSRSLVDRVIREGKPLIILDSYSEDEIDFSESLKLMKIKSVMCVPLISRSQIRGVLYVDSINEQFGFRHNDIILFKALGSPAALAIENALLSSNSMK
jgi:transcriptional regulator with GAF, ATPase, and Fis domain